MVSQSSLWSRLSICFLTAMFSIAPLQAATWLPFGPDGGDARRIVADAHDQTHLYAGTANGWIYESRNSGTRWHRLARVGRRDDLVLDSIVVDAGDSKHLFVGAWVLGSSDGGLYVSLDGGITWTSQAEMRGESVRALTASLSDPKILVAGTLKGVFRSTDAGAHWRLISPPDSTEIHEVESVAIDPKDPNIIYAGTWHLPWRTMNGGEKWENIKDGIIDDSDVFSIIIDPEKPQVVYASACSGIYKSENAGVLFHKVQGIPSTARRTRVLLQDPSHLDTVFAGTTEGLFRSVDAGHSWTRTTGPEIIVNDVSIDRGNSSHVLLATDRGGILASDDGGDTFHASNGGFSARQITTLRRDARHPDTLFVGVVNDKEWGGVFRSDNGGLNWNQQSDGLGGRDVFSLGQAADGTMIAGTVHGFFRLDSSAGAWVRAGETINPQDSAQASPGASTFNTRPPVLVVRNQFAKRNLPHGHSSSMRKKSSRKTIHSVAARASSHHLSGTHPVRVATAGKAHAANGKARGVAHPLTAGHRPVRTSPAHTHSEVAAIVPSSHPSIQAPISHFFDGSVYNIVASGDVLLAATSLGLRTSADNGVTWTPAGPDGTADWHSLAGAQRNVVAGSLHTVYFSPDAGITWSPVQLPEALTSVSAVAVEPSGEIWVGGREGVFVSSDAGNHWSTPKNLFVNSVNSLFFDEVANRIMVTTTGYSSVVFTVQLPGKQVTFADAGWNLRFARPVGDHLVAATLFDGIVVEPRMVESQSVSPTALPTASVR